MKNALTKDIFRTIQKEKKRFFSIMLITALGVTMLTGLKASCVDLRYSADVLYDEQHLFDIQVSSTLGLDENDIAALQELEDVSVAEGEYSKNVYTDISGVHEEVEIRTMGEEINVPTVVEGHLPQNPDEVAVTQSFLLDSGKKVGDTLSFYEDDEDPVFQNTECTITAEVLNPFDVNNKDGNISFRSSASADYTFFVTADAVDTDIYTAAYVSVKDVSEMLCYADAYQDKITDVKYQIDTTLKEKQQQMRYDTVYGDAMAEYNDARNEALKELDDAQQEIDDGWEELEDGQKKLTDGKSELQEQEKDADAQIADGRAQIAEGYAKLEDGRKQLEQSEQELSKGERQIAAARAELEQKKSETFAQIDDGLTQLKDARQQAQDGVDAIEAQLKVMNPGGADMELQQSTEAEGSLNADIQDVGIEGSLALHVNQSVQTGENGDQIQEGIDSSQDAVLQELYTQLAELKATVNELDVQIAALTEQREQAEAQFQSAEAELEKQAAVLTAGRQQYESGLVEWETKKAELDKSKKTLERQAASGKVQIASAWEEIRRSEQELLDGEQELNDGQQELDENRQEAMDELAEAKAEIDDIEMTKWYIQDRDSLSGYSNVDSDATSIEGLATFLPLIFFVVAILISLTAITRMVEEERGLIGTYKALGFKNTEIRRKYLVYAAGASIAGGIFGDICGFVILPKIIFTFFETMYTIPDYLLRFDLLSGTIGIIMFTAGVLIAVGFAVKTELAQMPAVLMRPLVPKNGSRIFLEYISALWKKMSFLNKVTARNLFRYKKRLVMTVVGIMGCTGLLVCGFAIKDSVTEWMPLQYENVSRYDIMAVALADDNEKLLSYMDDGENIDAYVNVQIDSVKIRNSEGSEQSVQMLVIPDDSDISSFIKLADISGRKIGLAADGIMLTHSASDVLNVYAGDTVEIQDLSLNETEVTISDVTEYYLGDMIYISQSSYEKNFAQEYTPNTVLIKLTESCKAGDPISYSEELGKKDGLVSTVSTDSLKAEFSKAFQLMNLVVYVILVLAAALAFVVLFTLSTTNISERCRELATIKVLGFYDREVHLYVNKETLILSVLGIILGLPLGRMIGSCLTWALKIPGIYFAVNIHKESYLICAVIAFVFALIVNQITNRLLNSIDPVEALKSVE